MEIRHISADTKDRCQRSGKSTLNRSVSKWNQSTDQLSRVLRIEDTKQHVIASDGKAQEQTFSQSRFYSRALNSQPTNPSSTPNTTSASTKAKSMKSFSVTGPSLSREEQIGGIHETIVLVNSTAEQTRHLWDDKSTNLGEIELEWINSTITDAENAANDLAVFMKQFRDISPQDCSSWKCRDYELALEKRSRMLLFHGKLEAVLAHLGSLPTALSKNESFFSPSDVSAVTPAISELPSETRFISVLELPGSSPVKSEQPVPEIVVTQHDSDDNIAIYSHIGASPPPSYEASGMHSTSEIH
ncbi:hypothetical protein N7491_006868 [Penicillium cf. griseofulvum]|uniref:Uncharacterized protein n=1 Tax=Penicillium cf. griseofulvum TaxID=2972120 RepID=A0A9W9IWL9_9EURO|nr:hypothetical protein N7472_010102 [Penicillium cf. griseofulvum]KAJ5429852.1 hypothetical protein N7491_006868 [Penicillium cf. griseofulvum]